jgi:hypothetical protein
MKNQIAFNAVQPSKGDSEWRKRKVRCFLVCFFKPIVWERDFKACGTTVLAY